MLPRVILVVIPLALASGVLGADGAANLDRQFSGTVRPFLERYCLDCHGKEKPEAELDLSPFTSVGAVIGGFSYWELVQERLEEGDMPPEKAKQHPKTAQREEVLAWLKALRKHEAGKNAGDPGPVLARRLNNAEYDYTIHDLTGVDIRPTKEFPVDPANQAGFDNSGESLAMSPALVNKYLGAARQVASHLVLKPDSFEFAPHPVVADTDRDKWGVLRIVEFYKRQPTDLAAYFFAAWQHQHRSALGHPTRTLAESAAAAGVSARYLARLWPALQATDEEVGPIARLKLMWRELPTPSDPDAAGTARQQTAAMRDQVQAWRAKLVPEVNNLMAPGVHLGSQTMVMWKNRQMAANRRTFDRGALQVEGAFEPAKTNRTAKAPVSPSNPLVPPPKRTTPPRPGTPNVVQKGGTFLAPAILTTGSSATVAMAANRTRGVDPDLAVPADPAERARHEAAFAQFADLFPDAFYITERARVYLDAVKEQDNAGRLLSAGLHSMTGYFRDDGPLYDMILDDAGRAELDRLWREFEFLSAVPQRTYTSFVWFERTDSAYLRDPEFDHFRPEDKAVTAQQKIDQLAALYLAKAQRTEAGEIAQAAIRDHFRISAANIRRVEAEWIAAEPSHLEALDAFAARAFRRPLTVEELAGLRRFYRASRDDNGLDHEEAMRDSIVRVLMSPHFCYRLDGMADRSAGDAPGRAPLTGNALAGRLSYFLWSSLPDQDLLTAAARGDLAQPDALAAHARRLLRDPHARRFATEFAGQWLDFRRFEEHNAVDRERFPAFDPRLRTAMFEEPVRLLHALIASDQSVLDLLYADYTFVNAPLARHYGMPVPEGVSDDVWRRVERAGDYDRGGLLPMAVFLTANSPGLRTSPVKRGYWVVRRVLGERIPPPPPVVPDLPNDERTLGDLTLREVLARHREDKSCASCHARFDSFGLVFEGFGPVGERRTLDLGGRPVETRAEFPGGREAAGVAGLRAYIRANREGDFVDHLCRKLLAYALGRSLLLSDDSLLATMKQRLAANGHRFSTLVETIVTSPQFRTKRVPGAAAKTASLP
jgi:hypothetical protein